MWDYGSHNRQNLTPIQNKPALVLGSLVHEALAKWTTEPELEPGEILLGLGNDYLDQLRIDYVERIGAPISEVELGETYDLITLASHMVENYKAFWKTPLPEGYRMIQPEQTCIVPIPDTYQFGRVFGGELEATLDGFVIDKREKLYVLERKTYGNRPRLEKLQMEDQFLAYEWVLSQLFPDYERGGILYDGLWKRDNKPLVEAFMRHTFLRADEELVEFEQHLRAEYFDMLSPQLYINRRWEGCYDCAFERLCTAQSRGEDVDYFRDTYYRTKPRDSRFTVTESD